MTAENNLPDYSLRTQRPDLVNRVNDHMGPEFVDMPVHVAAQFDTGDEYASDPRIRAAIKATGQFHAQGGSGPKKG